MSNPDTEQHKSKLTSIEARMASGEPFTFGQLWRPLADDRGINDPVYRVADRAIQKWRKKGWIDFTRGKQTVWTLTPSGRAALANGDEG